MKKGVKLNLLILVQVLFLSGIILASIEVGENKSESLKLVYGELESLSGWINISITGEDSDLKVTDSFGNNIDLSDLFILNQESGYLGSSNYYCNTKNCSSDYIASESSNSKSFDLSIGQTKTFGLKVTGKELSVEEVKFTLESDATSSCNNQIQVDFGNGLAKTSNYKVSSSSCQDTLSYGCFDDAIQSVGYTLNEEQKYCQRINLGEYPGFRIGAWIQKIEGTDEVNMVLLNNLTSELASCTISNSELSSSGSEVGCQINYSIQNPGNYFVCVGKKGNTGTLKIKGYSQGGNTYCGYYTKDSYKELTQSYKIFAEAKKYDSVGSMRIENNITNTPLNSIYNTYISKTYSNKNCSQGCILPIKITSNANQKITLKDLSISSTQRGGQTDPENNFYEITKSSSIISTNGFVKLYLDPAKFSVTDKIGNESLIIKIGDERVYEGKIEIQNVPKIKYLYPLETSSAYPTNFTIYANASSGVISSYLWKFNDDNLNKTTTTNSILHTFNQTGNYSLYVQIKDSSGRISEKTFEIEVKDPQEMISTKYSELKNKVTNIESQAKSYPTFLKEQILLKLNIEYVKTRLEYYKTKNLSADTLNERNEVLVGLLNLSVPDSINIAFRIDNVTYFPNEDKINLEIIKEIGGGTYEESESSKYKEEILSWQGKNMEVKIGYIKIVAQFDGQTSNLLSYFEVYSKNKEQLYPPYLFIKTLEGIEFDKDSKSYVSSTSGYSYFKLFNTEQKILFVTNEDVNFLNVPMFLSPSLSEIKITNSINPEEQQINMKWGLFILIVIFILVLGLIGYILLQGWYKNKYENYLFKGKNNMYNLITYIESQKKQGIEDSEVESKLRKAGWNGEQIQYAMKKYSGKRTGMLEIPIPSFLKKQDKKIMQNNPQNRQNPGLYGRPDSYLRK